MPRRKASGDQQTWGKGDVIVSIGGIDENRPDTGDIEVGKEPFEDLQPGLTLNP